MKLNYKMLLGMLLLAGTLFAGAPAAFSQISVGIQIGAPPPPRAIVVRPPIPDPQDGQFMWVEGYWYPVGHHYVWHRGYWTRPPYEGAAWVGPHYEGGRYYNGYWEGSRGRFEHDHRWDRDRHRDHSRWREDHQDNGRHNDEDHHDNGRHNGHDKKDHDDHDHDNHDRN